MKFKEIFLDDTKNVSKYKTSDYLDEGDICIVDQSKQLVSGYIISDDKAKVCAGNRIIFGDHTKVVKYIDFPFVCGADGTKVLKIKDESSIDYKYMYYYLLHLELPDMGYSRHFKYLKESTFIIPSYDKQIEIAKNLDCIKDAIDVKYKQYNDYYEMKRVAFNRIFGDLEENTNNYEIVNLNKIADYWNGLTYKPENITKKENGTLVLRSGNIQDGLLSFENNVYVDCKIKEKNYVQENDILMCSRNGSPRLVGKVALIKDLKEKVCFGAFMMIIRSKYYSFLKMYFETEYFRTQIATGTATINQITSKMMDRVKVAVPRDEDIKKYNEIEATIDNQLTILKKQIDDLNELFNKKLDYYFLKNKEAII